MPLGRAGGAPQRKLSAGAPRSPCPAGLGVPVSPPTASSPRSPPRAGAGGAALPAAARASPGRVGAGYGCGVRGAGCCPRPAGLRARSSGCPGGRGRVAVGAQGRAGARGILPGSPLRAPARRCNPLSSALR